MQVDTFLLTRRNLYVKPVEVKHVCKCCTVWNILLLTKLDEHAFPKRGLSAEPLGRLLGQAFGKQRVGSSGGTAMERTTALICCKGRRTCWSFAKSYDCWPKAKYKCPQVAKPWTDFIMFFSFLKLNHRRVQGNWDVYKVKQNTPINMHH